ncbi:hypothetical protein IAT40_001637 [Kwoniella sp. CBS 6097]
MSSVASIVSSYESLALSNDFATPRRASSASPIFGRTYTRPTMSFRAVSNPEMTEPRSTCPSSVAGPSTSTTLAINRESSEAGKKSQSAKRRERKKKLIAGEKERAEAALTSGDGPPVESSSNVLRELRIPSENIPSSSRLPPSIVEPHTPKPRKTALGHSTSHLNDMYTTPRASSTLATSKPITMSYDDNFDGENEGHEKKAIDDETGIERRRRKTRRGGKRARARRAHGRELAEDADRIDRNLSSCGSATDLGSEISDDETTSPTSSARTSRSGTPVQVTVHIRRSNGDLEEEDDDGDEVDELSALESEIGTPQSAKSMGNKSIMSVEDAVSSIDSFLSDPRNFMTIKANKLRLWQSLCIELGLVHLAGDELPDLPTVVCVPTPPRPRDTTQVVIDADHQDDDVLHEEDTGPEAEVNRYRPYLPKKSPLPQTLTQARKLLKENAHVNLVDYLEARKYCPPAYVGAYQGLLYPSMSAMKKYTRTGGKFALKDMVRAEWLEPLMKDFGIKKGKA